MLNKDILYLIFEELQDNEKILLRSCIFVNKTWCETSIPILWRDPWKCLKRDKEKSLINVLISQLSEDSRNILKKRKLLKKSYRHQKPLFNYISFCRHLNLEVIQRMIFNNYRSYKKSKISLIQKEIFNLLINENMKITHLYIPNKFDYQINLIPGIKRCFSEIEFLRCNTSINDKVMAGISLVNLKTLELDNDYYRILTGNYLENLSLHRLKILTAIIYQNCPNLKYLKLLFRNSNIIELENLLINCKYLEGLFIIGSTADAFDWDKLFEILTKSSPISLFKFKIYSYIPPKLDSLKLFLDNWKNRFPMLLQVGRMKDTKDLVEKYKEVGIIKKYKNCLYGKDFEWI
ncbi:11314_t:CDS:2 [Rhizophagus irregularis]|nr:11314_t:CDS:2 [Rhizophagus irregularis]